MPRVPSALRDGRCLVEVLERVVCSLDAAMPVAQRVLAIHAHHTGSHRVSTPQPRPPPTPAASPDRLRVCICVCLSGVQFSFSGSLDMAMSPAASMHPPSSSSQNYGAASASVAALDAAAEAADQLKRTAPLFRRDRPTDEAVSGPYQQWSIPSLPEARLGR